MTRAPLRIDWRFGRPAAEWFAFLTACMQQDLRPLLVAVRGDSV